MVNNYKNLIEFADGVRWIIKALCITYETVSGFISYLLRTSSEDLDAKMIHFGFFKNPSRIVSRIREIYAKIVWGDQNQDHTAFLTWLEHIFLPLLDKIRPIIPNI